MRDLVKVEWLWKIGQRHLVLFFWVEVVNCTEKLDDSFILICINQTVMLG